MSTQPEALRLADALQTGSHHRPVLDRSSAELRRLHEANQELLGALKSATEYLHDKSGCTLLSSDFQRGCRCEKDCSSIAVWKQARAAIAKGEAK